MHIFFETCLSPQRYDVYVDEFKKLYNTVLTLSVERIQGWWRLLDLPSELIIAIASCAPVYSVYNMRSCCSAFRLKYNDAFGQVRKDMYLRYFTAESSIVH